MDRGDDELKRQVDAALETLIKDGTVARVLWLVTTCLITPRRPSQRQVLMRSDAETIHHRVADRGREPQMQKVQTSKHAYSGLAASAPPASSWWVWIRTTFRFDGSPRAGGF